MRGYHWVERREPRAFVAALAHYPIAPGERDKAKKETEVRTKKALVSEESKFSQNIHERMDHSFPHQNMVPSPKVSLHPAPGPFWGGGGEASGVVAVGWPMTRAVALSKAEPVRLVTLNGVVSPIWPFDWAIRSSASHRGWAPLSN